MSAGIRILNDDFSPRMDLPFDWQAQNLSWKLPGGADQAVITSQRAECDLDLFENYSNQVLGNPLEVLSPAGEVIWSGYVESILYAGDQYRISCSLKEVSNRIIVRYPRLEAQSSPFQHWQFTDWLEDAASLARFGCKEKLITCPKANPYRAQQLLEEEFHALQRAPSFNIDWQAQTVDWRLQIIARGWWQRLGWVLDRAEQGLLAHLGGGKTNYMLGRLSSQSQLAQSFYVDQPDFAAGQICLRVAFIGQPLDDLQVAIHADDHGRPGSVISTATMPAASLESSWNWVNWQLDPVILLNESATYWLVIKRSGALNSESYYLVESDDGAGYARGALKRWDGSNWQSLPQDLRFCLAAEEDNGAQIESLIMQSEDFPYLTGVLRHQLSGNSSYRWRELELTCRQRIETWLQSYPHLSAAVNRQRMLEIISLPREDRIRLPLSTNPASYILSNSSIPDGSQWLGSRVEHALTGFEKSFWVESVVWRKGKGISWKFSS